MAYSWNDPDTQDLWTLTVEEVALLPGMTDKGRIGFAVQLKFMELHGRLPECHDELDPNAVQWLAIQLSTTADMLASYALGGRQGQRHRRTIRAVLDFRPTNGTDLRRLDKWLGKEIWVAGADRYRDPEHDLPSDFEAKRDSYYERLKVPRDGEVFIEQIQVAMRKWLTILNDGLPDNPKVRLRLHGKNLIHLTPLDRQPDPPNTAALKREIGRRWSDVELIDMVKEVDLRLNFTAAFRTSGSREVLDPSQLQRRLLLCLFGIGTNVGLKRVASQQPSVSFEELRHVKRRFVHV